MLQNGGVVSAIWHQLQESDELLQRQFEELSKGLQDEAPAVRITAAAGICALLNTYWELIPAGITAAYLKHLTGMSAVTLRPCCSGHHFNLLLMACFSCLKQRFPKLKLASVLTGITCMHQGLTAKS